MSVSTAPLPPPPALPPPPGSRPPAGRATGVGSASLALVGTGAALLALRAVDVHAPACPFRTFTGLACPGCGITRLSAAVAGGDLATALANDPAGVAFLDVLLAIAVLHLVQVLIRKQEPPPWLEERPLLVVLGGLLGLHWITTLAWGGMLAT